MIDPCMRASPAIIGGLPGHKGAWILVEGAVLERIQPFRQRERAAPESGGILLGYRRGAHLHVVDATIPGQEDRGTRVSFRRSANGHREQALAGWHRSDHTLDYVGEWHTHPERAPSPSGTDYRAWGELLAARPGQPLVFMILGIETDLWLGCGQGGAVRGVAMAPASGR